MASTLKIVAFLCVIVLFVNMLDLFILPARSDSDDLCTLHVISGAGDFSSVPNVRSITVAPGQEIRGSVTFLAHNTYPAGWVAPLVGIPSWGDKTRSWWTIVNSLPTGDSTQSASVDLQAPTDAGVYHRSSPSPVK